MAAKENEQKIKVLVRCIPNAGFDHHSAGGERWPKGESLREVSAATLAALRGKAAHFIAQVLSDEDFESNRERLGLELSTEEKLRRENDELRGRISKGEAAHGELGSIKSMLEESLKSYAEMGERLSTIESKGSSASETLGEDIKEALHRMGSAFNEMNGQLHGIAVRLDESERRQSALEAKFEEVAKSAKAAAKATGKATRQEPVAEATPTPEPQQ